MYVSMYLCIYLFIYPLIIIYLSICFVNCSTLQQSSAVWMNILLNGQAYLASEVTLRTPFPVLWPQPCLLKPWSRKLQWFTDGHKGEGRGVSFFSSLSLFSYSVIIPFIVLFFLLLIFYLALCTFFPFCLLFSFLLA